MATELERLRREHAVLRQEREILKRATAFFGPRRDVDEVPPSSRRPRTTSRSRACARFSTSIRAAP
ncbi:hypothetical protein MMSR116_18810 [Methylobacterium mesophilicum SR1.6/6]|uniref:Transposase n=1 Tax=Methylobacterium mesophilicum SR1.6/6 TaxID=908290 RepID=A0A6B9FRP0_9HYPH|nr:hypothetical protein MMSR116_18810 [Methylobacterium mesophilicum SR1.6/6]